MKGRIQPNPWSYAGAGLELVGKMLVLMGIGYLIDRWLDSQPIGVIVGAVLGIVGGLVKLVLDATKTFPTLKKNRDNDHGSNH